MSQHDLIIRITTRQQEALHALAAREDLPPEVYAAEVLAKHLYHEYRPGAHANPSAQPTPRTLP